MQINGEGVPILAGGDLVSELDEYTDALASIVSTLPYRMAAATFTVTLDSEYRQSGKIRFPAGRFVVPPIVMPGMRVGGPSGAYGWEPVAIDAEGFEARVIRVYGSWTPGPTTFSYIAVQMNPERAADIP